MTQESRRNLVRMEKATVWLKDLAVFGAQSTLGCGSDTLGGRPACSSGTVDVASKLKGSFD